MMVQPFLSVAQSEKYHTDILKAFTIDKLENFTQSVNMIFPMCF